MNELSDILQHHGVKGMKWGVIRDRNRPGGADGKWESEKVADTRGKLQKRLDSMKRERQWNSVLRELDKMSTKDINTVNKRIKLENSLKTLSKSKVATKKDKEDYLRRDKMSDQELSRKVTRLNAKNTLRNTIRSASEEQREFGIKTAQIGGSLGVKYALTKSITPKDIFDTVKNPKSSSDKAKKDLTDKAQNDILPKVLDKLKRS